MSKASFETRRVRKPVSENSATLDAWSKSEKYEETFAAKVMVYIRRGDQLEDLRLKARTRYEYGLEHAYLRLTTQPCFRYQASSSYEKGLEQALEHFQGVSPPPNLDRAVGPRECHDPPPPPTIHFVKGIDVGSFMLRLCWLRQASISPLKISDRPY